MKRLLLVLVLAAVAAPVASAHAAVPCRQKIYTDWRQDGKIATNYPLGCYRDALRHLGADAKIYSSLGPDIRAALQAAVLRREGKQVKAQVGKGFKALKSGTPVLVSGSGPKSTDSSSTSGDTSSSGVEKTASGQPAASTSSGVPLPILLLGGLAFALAAAGAIGAGVRHARSRQRPQ